MTHFAYTQILDYNENLRYTASIDNASNWPDWDDDDQYEAGDEGLTTGPYLGTVTINGILSPVFQGRNVDGVYGGYVVLYPGEFLEQSEIPSVLLSAPKNEVFYFGSKAGQRPTQGNDVLNGTPERDVVDLLGGKDTYLAHGGNDKISGGRGSDTISGGRGTDTLLGNAGNDTLRGDGGGDKLLGGAGADKLLGGIGTDTLIGGAGKDVLNGQAANDVLKGGGGADRLDGGSGRDVLDGGAGADRLFGGSGSDRLNGGAGDDILRGNKGNDVFIFSAKKNGADVIADFGLGSDKLQFRFVESTDDLEISVKQKGALIEWDGGSVFLNTGEPLHLDGDSFLF